MPVDEVRPPCMSWGLALLAWPGPVWSRLLAPPGPGLRACHVGGAPADAGWRGFPKAAQALCR